MFGIKTKIKRLIAHCIGTSFKSFGEKSIEELPFNTKLKLYIPTYDNSNQIVHPDIIVQNESPKYVLAYTPYPNTNDKFENPSIAVSDDGIHFREEKEGINPLVPAPERDHNDDPDLSLRNGIYSMLYLETVRPDYQNLMLLTSYNRIEWEKQVLLHEDLRTSDGSFMLSPAVIYKDDLCFLFAVNKNIKKGNRLYAVNGDSINSLNFKSEVKLNLNSIPDKFQPWHVDVFRDDKDGYVMLLCMVSPYSSNKKKYALFIGTSKDLINWKFQDTPVLTNCYRSSGYVKDNVLYIYFSSNVYADVWKTGLYKHHLG